MYNEIVKKFFDYHEINPETISKIVDTKLYSKEYFLDIFAKYAIYKKERLDEVSIGDIYGCDSNLRNPNISIFDLLGNYFQQSKKKTVTEFEKDQDYFSRANDNIFLSSREMIEKSNSINEYITVNRVDNDNNINLLYTNGMHRFLLLRSIYLKNISLFPDKIDEIKKEFKIKVMLCEIDEIKTFCNFIMHHYYKQTNKKIGYKYDYDTDRLMIGIKENNKLIEEYVFTDDELIEFVRPMIDKDLDFYKSINNEKFKKFMISLGYDSELIK